jgi:hypothetical protein
VCEQGVLLLLLLLLLLYFLASLFDQRKRSMESYIHTNYTKERTIKPPIKIA